MKLPFHATYAGWASAWMRCRDVAAGSDVVKSKGEVYLPRLSHGHLYAKYLERAVFLEITTQTIAGLLGLVFRKDPDLSLPDQLSNFVSDADLAGNSIYSVIRQVARECINPGRCGVLVDTAPTRPYVVIYRAEDIINWRVGKAADGTQRLEFLILRETLEQPIVGEKYATENATRYRVFELVDNQVTVTLYGPARTPVVPGIAQNAPTSNGGGIEVEPTGPTTVLSRRGQPVDRIPFCFFGGYGPYDVQIHAPPLKGIVDLNISHYRSYADLEHSRHYIASPQAYAIGFTPPDGRLEFGSSTVWLSEVPHASAGFLQQPPLEPLERALATKESQMAQLGASLLIARPRAAETAETARINAGKTTSPLTSLAINIGVGFTEVARLAAFWMSIADTTDVSIELNTDFVESTTDPAQLTALVAAWQAGGMSRASLVYNLQKGELLPPGQTVDAELADIEAELLAEPAAQQQQSNAADQQQGNTNA